MLRFIEKFVRKHFISQLVKDCEKIMLEENTFHSGYDNDKKIKLSEYNMFKKDDIEFAVYVDNARFAKIVIGRWSNGKIAKLNYFEYRMIRRIIKEKENEDNQKEKKSKTVNKNFGLKTNLGLETGIEKRRVKVKKILKK